MENQRQSEENEMQLKQDVSSRMQDQWNSSCRILCISQTHCQKLSEISQCQIRSTNFAMRISQCQFRNANFAMPISISQCQFQFRNANTLFICLIKTLAKFRIAKFTFHIANFANPFRIAKFTAFAKFTFAGLVILCN